ncbi:MAG: hypothetical protein ACRBCS_09950 [Cellvibrionaceae bacterium]
MKAVLLIKMKCFVKLSLLTYFLIQYFFSSQALAVTGVNPSGVNVNHTGVSTVFLTFQNLAANEQPGEAFWCSEVVATGASNFNPCVPGTLLGTLPARNNLSRTSGTGGFNHFTDVMTIPASVTRRAFQRAQSGESGTFFYVRRFRGSSGVDTDAIGASDTYITVTCRMAGGGARSPLALTDVRVRFETEEGLRPVYFLARNQTPPPMNAKVKYNGTGRLKGRWEVVMPGDVEPKTFDLLTEATLPIEQRMNQRRYTLLSRFDIFLPPTGEVDLPGPDPSQIPVQVDGAYKILLRIEASADKEGNSDTLAGTVISGGVAGFPMPVLRYYIGTPDDLLSMASSDNAVTLLSPSPKQILRSIDRLVFSWQTKDRKSLYELEIMADEETVLKAILKGMVTTYHAPPWLSHHSDKALSWRVKTIGKKGKAIHASPWRSFSVEIP